MTSLFHISDIWNIRHALYFVLNTQIISAQVWYDSSLHDYETYLWYARCIVLITQPFSTQVWHASSSPTHSHDMTSPHTIRSLFTTHWHVWHDSALINSFKWYDFAVHDSSTGVTCLHEPFTCVTCPHIFVYMYMHIYIIYVYAYLYFYRCGVRGDMSHVWHALCVVPPLNPSLCRCAMTCMTRSRETSVYTTRSLHDPHGVLCIWLTLLLDSHCCSLQNSFYTRLELM